MFPLVRTNCFPETSAYPEPTEMFGVDEDTLPEPEEIVGELETFFRTSDQLKGQKVLVTAGPTYEAIDPVRFIGNHSSGKMGFAIAEEMANRGAEVTLISGPVSLKTKNKNVNLVSVVSAEEMYEKCAMHDDYNIAVMAAAVADYTPIKVADQKIKKNGAELSLSLKKTKDILGSLGKIKRDDQILVGFALETENETSNAEKKLKGKNADIIVLNSLNDKGAGFGADTNKVVLFFKNGNPKRIDLKLKSALAKDIVDSIIELKS